MTTTRQLHYLKAMDIDVWWPRDRVAAQAMSEKSAAGKSTLASTLMGSPEYQVTAGTLRFKGDDIAEWPVDARGRSG